MRQFSIKYIATNILIPPLGPPPLGSSSGAPSTTFQELSQGPTEKVPGVVIVNIGQEYILCQGLKLPAFRDAELYYPYVLRYDNGWDLIAIFRTSEERMQFRPPIEAKIQPTIHIRCTSQEIIIQGMTRLPPMFRYGAIIPRIRPLFFPDISKYYNLLQEQPHLQLKLLEIIQQETRPEILVRIYFLCRVLSRRIAIFEYHAKQIFRMLRAQGYGNNFALALMFELEGVRTSLNPRDYNWFQRFLDGWKEGLQPVVDLLVRYQYYVEIRNSELERRYLILYHIFLSASIKAPDFLLDYLPEDSRLRMFFDKLVL